ncbi:hypothetical protein, unlikely [Trypanosoma congolense IL3000]|uniref:Variant surface glycoprotein n=1 Tax=Trypanosoma congolense (strain IL3000) TaxID=1068625 RepID=F9WIV4_TRYCI|nr:hypothetical protein, unlikely [Trypanosoma congolense IL3000]
MMLCKLVMVVYVMGVSGYKVGEMVLLSDLLNTGERVLNGMDRQSELLKEAIYGNKINVLFVENWQVRVRGRCKDQSLPGLLCAYERCYGCFAESLVGACPCTCTPGQDGLGENFSVVKSPRNSDT